MKNQKYVMKSAAVFLLAVVMVFGALTGCGSQTPLQTVENGIDKLASNVAENYSVVNTLSDALNGGSIEVNASLDELVRELVGLEIRGIDGSLAMKFGSEAKSVNAVVKLNGVSVADAGLYADKDGFALTSDAILGKDVAYGSRFDGIDERFEQSIFAVDGDYDDYAGELGQVVKYLSNTDKVVAMLEELTALKSALKTDIYTAIESNSKSLVQKGTYSLNGENIKTHNVEIVAEDEQLYSMVTAVCDVLLESDDFKSFCDEYDDIGELFGITEIYEKLGEAKAELEENRENMDGYTLEVHASVGANSKELVALEIAVDRPDEEPIDFKFVCGPSSKELKIVEITLGSGDYQYELTYKVKEDTEKSYKSKLELRTVDDDYDSTDTVFEYSWDKADGNFKLELGGIEIEGTIICDREKAVISIEVVSGGDMDIRFRTFQIIINAKDEIEAVENYEDILTVTREEFEGILKPVFELVKELGTVLG